MEGRADAYDNIRQRYIRFRLIFQAKNDEIADLKQRLAEIVAVASFGVRERPLPLPNRMVTDDVATLQALLLSQQTLISELYELLDETVDIAFDPEDEIGPPPRFAPTLERQ